MTVSQHYVVYQMPGTFLAESTQREVESWDVEEAKASAPRGTFAFHFITRSRGPDDLDAKITATSNRYFLGGQVFTLDEMRAKNELTRKTKNKPFDTLLRNMEGNGYARVIQTPFGNWQPFEDTDILL